MEHQKIDFGRYRQGAETEEVARHLSPQRVQTGERPTFFQRAKEQERSDSSWAGSSMGGGTWAGRTRS